MEVGKFYKGLHFGTVVRCTTPCCGDTFGGIVVDKAHGYDEVGYEFGGWICEYFKEYTPEDERKATIKDNAERFKEMTATFVAKNKDYGNSFDKTIDEEGYVAFQVRALDKLNRFKSILSSQSREVKDESILDTLKDLANYCIMCSIKIENDLENKKEVKYYENI